jgi:hypothetical protein
MKFIHEIAFVHFDSLKSYSCKTTTMDIESLGSHDDNGILKPQDHMIGLFMCKYNSKHNILDKLSLV